VEIEGKGWKTLNRTVTPFLYPFARFPFPFLFTPSHLDRWIHCQDWNERLHTKSHPHEMDMKFRSNRFLLPALSGETARPISAPACNRAEAPAIIRPAQNILRHFLVRQNRNARNKVASSVYLAAADPAEAFNLVPADMGTRKPGSPNFSTLPESD
jgi:hypothetical protein